MEEYFFAYLYLQDNSFATLYILYLSNQSAPCIFLGSGTVKKHLELNQPDIFSGQKKYGPCLIKLQFKREVARLPLLFWSNRHQPLTQPSFFQLPTIKKKFLQDLYKYLGSVTDPTFQNKNRGHRLTGRL